MYERTWTRHTKTATSTTTFKVQKRSLFPILVVSLPVTALSGLCLAAVAAALGDLTAFLMMLALAVAMCLLQVALLLREVEIDRVSNRSADPVT